MSVIAVDNVPFKWSLRHVVKAVAKHVHGRFDALNFVTKVMKHKTYKATRKTCYLRLSETLDPWQVIRTINYKVRINKAVQFYAYIPDHVPDLPLGRKRLDRPYMAKPKKGVQLEYPDDKKSDVDSIPDTIVYSVLVEIVVELQSKYTGLYNLSRKNHHKLLETITMTVLERVVKGAKVNREAAMDCCKLSRCYRKMYPHTTDFQLILSTLHRLEDAEGLPRSQLSEKDLMATLVDPYGIDDIPYTQVNAIFNKYSDRIVKKVSDYINGLKIEIRDTESEEQVARNLIRIQLKKIVPLLPVMVRQTIQKHFVPEKAAYHRVRIYGEPQLPKELIKTIKRYNPVHIKRSTIMYNMIRFNVPPAMFASLRSLDGTHLGGYKLIVRSSDIPLYRFPESLKFKVVTAFIDEPDAAASMDVQQN